MYSVQSSQTTILVNEVEKAIAKHGIMFRLFFREKTADSLEAKTKKNPGKYGDQKKIQDIIGIRIALYFIDDILATQEILERTFEHLDKFSQIDTPDSESFKAIRRNLIFKLPDYYNVKALVGDEYQQLVDNTFEVQLRTILSEGWHEVDHDLRYKCEADWVDLDAENRALNGVYATLETSEWTLLKLFEDLSYTHYKSTNVRAMLKNKFRLRLKKSEKDDTVIDILTRRPELTKAVLRYERSRFFNCVATRPGIPVSIAFLVYVVNFDELKDSELFDTMPEYLHRWWAQA
ncbi:RelA/SpoT domain-containing protein [Pseudomonas protegens]|uniref:RelA/SpoT domain-containing protein n=1 Tax=Pseudomonas protegens TaxID=380021 RepID=UPI0021C62B7C|nr:RelA/SpoT domain-containing protein [Pseudomonas protegens]MCU1765328.1 RelA/SpoT domain-containing protein [Pseudomonas protegens]